ncbi:MAG: hypothetical protein ACU0CT_02485 [Paracoccaceae bacterium]
MADWKEWFTQRMQDDSPQESYVDWLERQDDKAMAETSREFRDCVALMVRSAEMQIARTRPPGSKVEVLGGDIHEAAEFRVKHQTRMLRLVGDMTQEQAERYLLARMTDPKNTT